ncbi:cutinase family protein [Mycobacterium sp. SMC-18]|uniref:cutinase family protein n=1 Tax=Mycobacteriaceae TaxID=1762 RepID=UPI001BB384B7|nr:MULTISPECIES: cutinase family protein [unclassified Mycolicibacterium]BCI80184.1 serine esterase [Mycolicibacterium sp. TY66]BCJ82152.1 serine esterase [Mycolicibacterium sp. TY81]
MNRNNRWVTACAAVVLSSAGVAAGVAGSGSAAAEACPDVQVVFARGTFEPAGVGGVGQAFVDALRARTPGKSVDVYAVNYPASLDFATAADGVIDAKNKVMATASACPNTKVVLGGYSQGAAVAAYITEDSVPQGFTLPPGLSGPMPASVADRVAGVVLFGKPSSGFLQMIYTGAPPITVGPRYVGKTDDICIPEDPVCSPTGGDQGAHGAYQARGLTDSAADYVASRVGGTAKPAQPTAQAAGVN